MDYCFREDKDLCIEYSQALYDLINKKYTYGILAILDKYGKLRFNEILRKIEGLNQRMLSIRLKEMEKAGLVKREVETQEIIKVYYSITKEGKAVKNALQILISIINLMDSKNRNSSLC